MKTVCCVLIFLDQKSEIGRLVNDVANRTEDMLDSASLNFSLHDERCNRLNKVLMDLYAKKEQKVVAEFIASSPSFAVIIKFMSKLSECKF